MTTSKTPTQITYNAYNAKMESAIIEYIGAAAIPTWRGRANPTIRKQWKTLLAQMVESGFKGVGN